MPFFPDHPRHHLRRVVLPSGKTIEVVYFEGVEAAADPTTAPTAMHVCPVCACELVHPLAWEQSGAEHWDVLLRCPNCEWQRTGTYGQEAVDDLDVHLDRGTEALVSDLKRLVHANMQDGIDRFIAALSADLIVPDDF